MKVILVFPPFYLETMYNLPPLGLINIATGLRGTRHQVEIVDFVLEIRRGTLRMGKDIYNDCADLILEKAPDLVAFSAQCTTYPAVIRISEIIKEKKPDINIVVGGHNASFVDIETLERYRFIDAIVRGEGEVTFKDLLSSYEAGSNGEGTPGVTYRRGKHIVRNIDRELIARLDDLPLPDYSFSPRFSEYRDACELPRSIAILEVGRGCPHKCVYCSESIMWRRRTRTFSVSRLINEMENLHKNQGAECFLLAYDQFTAKRSFVEAFCRAVLEKGLSHLPWYCISRLDSVDAELLGLMREAGCESMCYGIDSGSEKTLAFINKNINHELLYQRVTETAEQGIVPTLSFVIGFPEEEREDIDKTLFLALRSGIVGNNNPLIQMPTVLPGTELHKRYAHDLVRQVDTYFALGLEFDQGKRLESDEDIINSDPVIFSSFYNLKCRGIPLEDLNLIASYFPLIVRFYPKTFLILSVEYNKSVSGLFIQLLVWLKDRLKRDTLTLTPQDCYNHFREFVFYITEGHGEPEREYLYEMLKYEYLAIEVGKFTSEKGPFEIDLQKSKDLKPKKSGKIIMEKFDFDIPSIIIDYKDGVFDKQYDARETFLVFRQEDHFLSVFEINSFAKDFLESCDGNTTLSTISGRLYKDYGRDIKDEKFFDSCIEALKTLGEMGLLEP